MKNFGKLLVLLLIFVSSIMQARIVSGLKIPEKFKVNGSSLILNGAGVREKFFMDLYVGALYLNKRSRIAKTIIESEENMAIRLYITSSLISSKKMRKAVNEGFENSTNGNIIPIKKQIDEFIAVFKDEINKGDIFEMVYIDSIGTKILKNGKLSKTIKGIKFKRSLFGIWLCDEPAQESLKEEMLGKD